jgi:hypothetical protein
MFTNTPDPFADMPEDNLGPAPKLVGDVKAIVENSFVKAVPANPELFRETCVKCRGTGRYLAPSQHGSQCFACKGVGYKEYKTSAEDRVRSRAKAAQKKIDAAQAKLTAFEAEHPEIAAWWTGSTFGFAIQMREKVKQFGTLTVDQLAACVRTSAKFKAAVQARVVHQAALPVLDVRHITDAFDRARSNGVKRPKLRLYSGAKGFVFSRAPDGGQNAGAIYVKDLGEDEGLYMGKITDGKFQKSRLCTPENEAEIIKICQDPAQAAIAYGKQFGSCSICARELSNPESIALGIGPICRANFFS